MSRLADDMARWEAGDLPLTEVEARHPATGVHGLADLHAHLSALLEEDPILETAGVWMEIRGRLQSPASPFRGGLRRRVVRPLVAAAAAVLLLGGIAYGAGVEPVREGVDRVVRVVKGFFHDDRKGVQAPGDSEPTMHRRDERSGPGSGEDAEDSGDEDRSGPGGGGDDPQDNDDEDRSGPGDGDDREDEPEETEQEGPDDDHSSSDSSNSGSGSDDEPDEKSGGSEGSDEADD
jgi:hypothetical protein